MCFVRNSRLRHLTIRRSKDVRSTKTKTCPGTSDSGLYYPLVGQTMGSIERCMYTTNCSIYYTISYIIITFTIII